ncbi:hypothetical protein FA95DRAFT_1490264 [Auriscalpium vulgare]|uniref:Uncharacterized protein n=1 Tax=Auriscalpium vulgare TaxID=40419 RepID=A0ACB8RXU9_9AGAM|nr:hypothetical protein FA95DRAFT_1490264 [Auriscalpium vulgare]
MSRLPPDLTSLYRLVLRASSASVMHHHAGRRYLRSLWRPVFREAIVVTRKLEDNKLAQADREQHVEWLGRWNSNMDRTLEFLSTSARSRGLPSRVTRNLSFLHYGYRQWQKEKLYGTKLKWDPNPAKHSGAATAVPRAKRGSGKDSEFERQAWGALEEAVRMAEGKSGMSLGRIEFLRRRA